MAGAHAASKQPQPQPQPAHVSLPGWGILFFHQLGVVRYLSERFDMSQVRWRGSSAGALVAVLAACEVRALLI